MLCFTYIMRKRSIWEVIVDSLQEFLVIPDAEVGNNSVYWIIQWQWLSSNIKTQVYSCTFDIYSSSSAASLNYINITKNCLIQNQLRTGETLNAKDFVL